MQTPTATPPEAHRPLSASPALYPFDRLKQMLRNGLFALLSVIAADAELHSTGHADAAMPVPTHTAPAENTSMKIDQYVQDLDSDDFDTREAAKLALVALAKTEIERTKQRYIGKEHLIALHKEAVNFPDRARLLQEIIDTIEEMERARPLAATIFRAPEGWNIPGATLRMEEALSMLMERTGQPMYWGYAGKGFLDEKVRVDNLDGLTFMEVLTELGRKENNTAHSNAQYNGQLYIHAASSPHSKIVSCSDAVRAAITVYDNSPNHVTMQFDTEPTQHVVTGRVITLTTVLPDGKEQALVPDAVQWEGLYGLGFTLPQATEEGQTVDVRAKILFTVQKQKHMNVVNHQQPQTFTEEGYTLQYAPVFQDTDGSYVVVATCAGKKNILDSLLFHRLGCVACTENGQPLQAIKAETYVAGSPGKFRWRFATPPKRLTFSMPQALSEEYTGEFLHRGVPQSTKPPVR